MSIAHTTFNELKHLLKSSNSGLLSRYKKNKHNLLFSYYWKPSIKVRALIYICHGFGEHMLYYNQLAENMIREGFLAFGHDHSGHGHSHGSRGFVGDISNLADDVVDHITEVKLLYNDLPVFLVGHSMGGLIALKVAGGNSSLFRGIVFVAPLIKGPLTDMNIFQRTFINITSKFFPNVVLSDLNLELVTRDKKCLDYMHSDDLRCKGLKAQTLKAFLEALKVQLLTKHFYYFHKTVELDVRKLQCPFLILHGENDQLCFLDGSQFLYSNSDLAVDSKELKVYPNAFHNLFQEIPEIRLEAIRDIIAWVNKQLL